MLRDVLVIAPFLCMLSLTDCSSGSSAAQTIVPTMQTTVAAQSAVTATPQAAPPNVILDASSNPLQDLSVYETGYSGTFTITSSNTSVVTATPGLVPGEFMINELSTGSATLLVKDANGGSLAVPVSAL
jgi:hypothetical protein